MLQVQQHNAEILHVVGNIQESRNFLVSLEQYLECEEKKAQNLHLSQNSIGDAEKTTSHLNRNLIQLRERIALTADVLRKISETALETLTKRLQADLEELEKNAHALSGRVEKLPGTIALRVEVMKLLQEPRYVTREPTPELRERIQLCIDTHPQMPLPLLQELYLAKCRLDNPFETLSLNEESSLLRDSKLISDTPLMGRSTSSKQDDRHPVLYTYPEGSIAPRLPKKMIQKKFLESKLAFGERWDVFCEGRSFVPFREGRLDEDLKDEFALLRTTRAQVYYSDPDSLIKESNDGYEVSLPLLSQDLVRLKNGVAFAYNNTDLSFNASTISARGKYYIACEGTRSKDIPRFFTFLPAYQVTHIVRLTGSYDGVYKKCHPYWEGLLQSSTEGLQLNVPMGSEISYPIRYYIEESWVDNQGIDPKKLLELVSLVKNDVEKKQGLLAVHCSLGIGRTGTFLAALIILDALEHDEPFSIQEIVFQLSLQRVNSVSTPEQYITLHRFVEAYLKKIRGF